MKYGVSYYPEHKTEEDLRVDIKLLIESGINTVRMGEFAWCRMEPEEGVYQFKWLIDVVNELGVNGINTILCTPTACPPAWLINKYPDILYQDNRRVRRPFGGRRHYCYTNETYRKYSDNIASTLFEAFADNQYIIGIQIDNEPAQEGTGRCTCKSCEEGFHKWLEEKYITIDEFNSRSGSVFWSQEYSEFKQIQIPINSIEEGTQVGIRAFYENPTVRMDFEKFSSDMQLEYQNIQLDAAKKILGQDMPVTTNGTGLATNSIDYYKSFKDLDNYAFDYYPGLRDARVDSFPYAFGRGVKDKTGFWVLEFMSGGGHRLGGSGRLQPNPGALKQAVIHSFAHGAEMMLHFQYRTYPFGAEQLNYAIVDMDGVPRRRYYEMKETASILEKLKPLQEAEFKNEVAICFDYASHWALRMKPANDPDFNYINYATKLYNAFEKNGINTDVISIESDITKYKVLVLPAQIILSKDNQIKLQDYVNKGGTLIGTFLTSVKNEDNVGYTQTLPAGLTEVFGSTVEEVEPVFKKNVNTVQIKLNSHENPIIINSNDGMWSELLGGDSKGIGVYQEDYKEGHKVISENYYGKGYAYYLGCDISEEAYKELFLYIADKVSISRVDLKREDNVEVVRRYLDNKEVLFLFNFTNHETKVVLDDSYVEYVTDTLISGEVILNRNESKIIYKKIK